MLDITITTDDAALRRILEALEELTGPPADLIRILGDAVAQDGVMPRVINYPAPSRKSQPFKSAQQRKAFFAMLRSGSISVPYQRSYRLQRGWRPEPTGDGARVVNDTAYAPLVMGEQQGDYFRGNWLTTTRIATDVEQQAAPWIAQGAVTLWIAKRGLG